MPESRPLPPAARSDDVALRAARSPRAGFRTSRPETLAPSAGGGEEDLDEVPVVVGADHHEEIFSAAAGFNTAQRAGVFRVDPAAGASARRRRQRARAPRRAMRRSGSRTRRSGQKPAASPIIAEAVPVRLRNFEREVLHGGGGNSLRERPPADAWPLESPRSRRRTARRGRLRSLRSARRRGTTPTDVVPSANGIQPVPPGVRDDDHDVPGSARPSCARTPFEVADDRQLPVIRVDGLPSHARGEEGVLARGVEHALRANRPLVTILRTARGRR